MLLLYINHYLLLIISFRSINCGKIDSGCDLPKITNETCVVTDIQAYCAVEAELLSVLQQGS